MTNDGELTNRLTHPRYQHEKEYRVLVVGHPSDQQLNGWRKGLILDDGTLTRPAKVWIEPKDSNETWLGVILKEGKKRQIRRMAEVSGLVVTRLIRIRIANLVLGELLPTEWRELNHQEIHDLVILLGIKG
jgi:23S rRNA pseudouridine2605 synthase